MHGYLEFLCTNPYGSHVVQTLVALLAPLTAPDHPMTAAATDRVTALCTELKSHWAELIMSSPASHPLRTMLLVLSGRDVALDAANAARGGKGRGTGKKKKKKKKRVNDPEALGGHKALPAAVREVPSAFHAVFEAVVEELLATPRSYVGDLVVDPSASPLLQMVVDLANAAALPATDALIQRCLGAGSEEYDPAEMAALGTSAKAMVWVEESLVHSIASHVVEVAARASSDKLFGSLLKTWVFPKAPQLATHRIANFVLQTIVTSCRTNAQRDSFVDLLTPCLDKLFDVNHTGVVWRLAEAAAAATDAREIQTKTIAAIMDVAAKGGAPGGARGTVQWLTGVTAPTGPEIGNTTHELLPNGCRIVSALLRCKPSVCRPVLDSVVAMNARQLSDLACSPWGSRHVVVSGWSVLGARSPPV